MQQVQFTTGKTNTAAALNTLLQMFSPLNGDRDPNPNLAIFITDGRFITFVLNVSIMRSTMMKLFCFSIFYYYESNSMAKLF